MSLATRCTSCDTVFRVVQDQLKVSEGWVRCGRCQEVFNALESLFDLGADSVPPTAPPAPVDAEATAATPTPAGDAPSPGSEDVDRRTPEPRMGESWLRSRPAEFDATPASRVAARDRVEFDDARFNSELLAEASGAAATAPPDPTPADEGRGPPEAAPDVATPTPEFLLAAERETRRARPGVRLATALLCLALLLALALQAAWHFRDLLAAMFPAVRPALEAACDAAGCRIEPLQRIDDLVIESSALTNAPAGDAVRLSVTLRNRGASALAMPSIELTLTDAGGQLLARRALSPAEFGVGTATLPANAETTLQLMLAVSGRRATGYTVEPFYP